jgi:thermostable 8-oxoguanine DNA glycosylase
MKPIWEIDKATLTEWSDLVKENSNNKLVIERKFRNVKRKGIDLSKANLWKVFVGCQVTTQQRSGPNTPVSRFLDSNSSALSYAKCKVAPSLRQLLEKELTGAGLRRAPTMASNLVMIHDLLESGEWSVLLQHLASLESNTTQAKEVKVAQYLQSKKYPGLGPKQSRNFIQWVGLSRYEIPLDSRILKKLKQYGCAFVPRAGALSDETVYRFVQAGLQQVAKSLGIYPCVLDACIFSSFDATDG